jgi:hypothetical protein
MNCEPEQTGSKGSYEPPRLVTISLRPEEAVLGNCKTASSVGPAQPSCTFLTVCKLIGS